MKDTAVVRRAVPLVLAVVFAVLVLVSFLRSRTVSRATMISPSYERRESLLLSGEAAEEDDEQQQGGGGGGGGDVGLVLDPNFKPSLPKQTELSLSLEQKNRLPPRNRDLFPKLAKDHIKIVLYVHNRPQYLQVVIRSLSSVQGIGETLLIVSHDGFYPEMDSIVQSIRFCQITPQQRGVGFSGSVRQPPLSKDCVFEASLVVDDEYHLGRFGETKRFGGHILFIEEDHFIYPNAYRNIQLLTAMKPRKCPECYAVNLAPSDVTSKGEGGEFLVAEKVGNIGYAFNRTVWRKIHAKAREFCSFDDYNWDITMWATVYPSFGTPVYTLRGPRRSAAHFGKCGLHQGQGSSSVCIDDGNAKFEIDEIDKVANIKYDWPVQVYKKQGGYQAGFRGWGGWGDERDRELCLSFAYMYHVQGASSG
uniref:Alpha-1,6-mannosyl-glycoprotein 2-beta-N-acetylglucosaminyltransferase n=1 Tax=Ananas comosus var. bracteatus TaxID=296719 RepID=A0A6V7QFA9_ANACO|nr:unnamed protein product [Ananas comosus var. bracteatus]